MVKAITAHQIEMLRAEAVAAGDDKMVRVCDAALSLGEESSEWLACERAIADAKAQDDDA